MNSRPDVHLDWCSHAAARYAVEHWHYSQTMPRGKLVKIGVWEAGQFIGALLYGLGGGATCDGRRYGLARHFQMAEMQRIALRAHQTPVSRVLMLSVRMLRRHCPNLRLLISYADLAQGHHGGIYQAANWIFTGKTAPDWIAVWEDGRRAHSRIAHTHRQFGIRKTVDISQARRVPTPGKYRYLYPLDADMRTRILPLAQPYPKRPTSIGSDAASVQDAEGGATPAVGLFTAGKEA